MPYCPPLPKVCNGRSIWPLLGTLVVGLLTPPCCLANWELLRAEGAQFQKEGRYKEALDRYEAALAEAGTGSRLPLSLTDVGVAHRLLGRYGDAQAAFARTLAVLEGDASSTGLQIATACNNLAVTEMLLGRYTKAQRLYERAFALYERAPGIVDGQIADLLNNVGSEYHRLGLYREAKGYFTLALERWPEGTLESAAVLTNYGSSALELRDTADAESALSRALLIRNGILGPDHPDMAKTLYYLAVLAHRKHDYRLARELYGRVISIEQRSEAPNADLAICWANYAMVLHELHQKREAKEAERHSQEILAATPPRNTIIDLLLLVPQEIATTESGLPNKRRLGNSHQRTPTSTGLCQWWEGMWPALRKAKSK